MAKKKKRKLSKPERREARLRKARQWVLTYTGSHIVRAYRKKFNVDYTCALNDLGEIGALQPEKLALLRHHEEIRLQKKREEREAKSEQERYDLYPDSDDRFFFIAGHTSGGAPYGVTWEEMGMDPYEPLMAPYSLMSCDPYERELEKLTELKAPVLFAELEEVQKAEVYERLGELIDDFFMGADYLPGSEDRDAILKELCEDITASLNQWDTGPQIELIPDDGLKSVFDGIIAEIVAELKEEGIELPTFMDTLLVVATERLIIRRFYQKDLDPLWKIMRKPEVMYAWESGFKKSEVRKWLNRIYTGYRKDGHSYFAVTLKETGKLIGQAGLMKLELNGETVVEIGYIFDDSFWGQGYAMEAARACVDLAFERLSIDKLYATIRPENAASVKVAEKLRMRKTGEVMKTYKDIEMPHDFYLLER